MKAFPKHLLTQAELRLFRKYATPEKIQDFLITLPFNNADTVQSVRRSLITGKAHCFEGALIAAALLWFHGHEPLLLDLKTTKDDQDHIVVLFKRNGLWGALSSTHHAVLRYRDPIFKNVRELALSYFHEYFLNSGVKTMRSFSTKPFSLASCQHGWLFNEDELYDLGADIDDAPHTDVAARATIRKLRKSDPIERRAANIT